MFAREAYSYEDITGFRVLFGIHIYVFLFCREQDVRQLLCNTDQLTGKMYGLLKLSNK